MHDDAHACTQVHRQHDSQYFTSQQLAAAMHQDMLDIMYVHFKDTKQDETKTQDTVLGCQLVIHYVIY